MESNMSHLNFHQPTNQDIDPSNTSVASITSDEKPSSEVFSNTEYLKNISHYNKDNEEKLGNNELEYAIRNPFELETNVSNNSHNSHKSNVSHDSHNYYNATSHSNHSDDQHQLQLQMQVHDDNKDKLQSDVDMEEDFHVEFPSNIMQSDSTPMLPSKALKRGNSEGFVENIKMEPTPILQLSPGPSNGNKDLLKSLNSNESSPTNTQLDFNQTQPLNLGE